MEIQPYLERIGCAGLASPTLDTLRRLQRAHLLTVPFENLDVHLGRPISLHPADLSEKIVRSRRGGFCYELNSLFANLLLGLGYDVTYLSARDAREDGTFGPEFDHLTLLVKVGALRREGNGGAQSGVQEETDWLVDVGWGDTFREPLQLKFGQLQVQGERAFRIERIPGGSLLWQRTGEGRWKRDFRFSLVPRGISDFFEMCRYQQESPQSRWTQERLCTIAQPDGRVTLRDARLVIRRDGQREEREIDSPEGYSEALYQYFGIVLPPSDCARWF